MTHSPRFQIREIVIRTGDRVTEQEVKTLADLSEGDNILEFRLSDCVEGIEIHPWVARASVMRQFPDRVVIDVVEREPVAVISLGSLYYVDKDGEIFKKILPGERIDYPVITGVALRDVVEDKPGVDALIMLGLEIVSIAGEAKSFTVDDISEIHLSRTYGATLIRAADGLRIRFGRGELLDKWRRLERTQLELGDEAAKVAELDLNYESRVTVKLREGYRVSSPVSGDRPGIY
jgi:cell division septal protein FtsQ